LQAELSSTELNQQSKEFVECDDDDDNLLPILIRLRDEKDPLFIDFKKKVELVAGRFQTKCLNHHTEDGKEAKGQPVIIDLSKDSPKVKSPPPAADAHRPLQ